LNRHGLTAVATDAIKPFISFGAVAMINESLSRSIPEKLKADILETMLDLYQNNIAEHTVFFKGMSAVETAALTMAMMRSGDMFEHPPGPVVVDKHSTGGIGDKVSLILAPLVACAGCRVPMVSGRGLGITGGTLDKLESIPGFRVEIGMDEAAEILADLGVVMMGQTDRFCPADKKLYALRDVTGTVPSIALITASIMSKKMAESLGRLVLDVKYGSGAFMKTRELAQELADGMIAVGKEMGVEVSALLNPMSEPTGRAVGNLVWARVPGFPAWPAVIERARAKHRALKPAAASLASSANADDGPGTVAGAGRPVFVRFLGARAQETFAWAAPSSVISFGERLELCEQKLSKRSLRPRFKQAVAEAIALLGAASADS
jgi:hypothetical protein